MNDLTRDSLKILALAWTAFLLASVVLSQFFPIPNIPLLVDRSYCNSEQWQAVTKTYAELYAKHQRKQVNLNPVILFSDLGEETLQSPPLPSEFRTVKTFGRFNPERLNRLKQNYPNAQFLQCVSSRI